MVTCFKFNNFCYIPTPKNGSTTFIKFFKEHNWEPINIASLSSDLYFFGHITQPLERHTKGIIEFLINVQKLDMLNDKQYRVMLTKSILDEHSMPLACMPFFYQTHWIPLDFSWQGINGNDLTNRFFEMNSLPFKILTDDIQYRAWDDKQKLYKKLERIKDTIPSHKEKLLTHAYAVDTETYWKMHAYYQEIAIDIYDKKFNLPMA